MDYIFWEFREKSEEKSEIFELYHLNSEHTPRTQCFNAPKMNYTLPEQTEVPKQTLWTVPFLSDIPDSGFSLKQALMQRRTSWNFSADPLTDQELETYIAYCFGINNKKENLKTYPSGGGCTLLRFILFRLNDSSEKTKFSKEIIACDIMFILAA